MKGYWGKALYKMLAEGQQAEAMLQRPPTDGLKKRPGA